MLTQDTAMIVSKATKHKHGEIFSLTDGTPHSQVMRQMFRISDCRHWPVLLDALKTAPSSTRRLSSWKRVESASEAMRIRSSSSSPASTQLLTGWYRLPWRCHRLNRDFRKDMADEAPVLSAHKEKLVMTNCVCVHVCERERMCVRVCVLL